jgi:heptosyltransferase-2
MSSQRFKIWVRGANWVGDSILTIPALEALRRARPDAHITLAVRPWVSELFAGFPVVDHLQIYDRKGIHRGRRGRRHFVEELERQRFDQAILFPNSFEAAYLVWRAGIPERVGYATDGRGWLLTERLKISNEVLRSHQTAYYLDILRQAEIIFEIPPVQSITLRVSEEQKQRAQERLVQAGISRNRQLIGLNPGAYFGSAKRWLPERYAALADRFVDALGADVLIFGAANERSMAEAIACDMRHRPKIFSGETTLGELAALLECSALLVTNDSGPMHLSAAVGTRTLAIFGPTDERATAPLGPHTRVVKRPVSCSPCLLRECPLDHRCMDRVTVEEVYRAAVDLLSR